MVTPIFAILCRSFHPDPLEHLARSVPFHTLLCNRHGRKCIGGWVTTSNKVKGEYKYISVFVFRSFGGVITGSVCTLLDTQGRVDACLLGLIMHKENGRKQKRNVDARLPIDGEVNRMTREDRSRSYWVETRRHCHHTERGGFFIVSSTPLVKSLLMSALGESLQTELPHSPSSCTFQLKKRRAGKPLNFQGCLWIILSERID